MVCHFGLFGLLLLSLLYIIFIFIVVAAVTTDYSVGMQTIKKKSLFIALRLQCSYSATVA